MKIGRMLYLSNLAFLFSCNSGSKENELVKSKINSTEIKVQTKQKINTDEEIENKKHYKSLLVPTKTTLSGYDFEFGYFEYNEEKYGWENPGYLRIYYKGKMIFNDKFEGEGEVNIESLGYHKLSGEKLLFTLNYGTAACDYNQVARYYVINLNNQVNFLSEYYSSCGGDGYACHFYNKILPEDSLGLENSLLIVEGLVFNEHDQVDRFDTTLISFSNNTFKIKKLTNNPKKAK